MTTMIKLSILNSYWMRFFVIFQIIKVVVSVIWPRLITLAETMIIADITKTDFPSV